MPPFDELKNSSFGIYAVKTQSDQFEESLTSVSLFLGWKGSLVAAHGPQHKLLFIVTLSAFSNGQCPGITWLYKQNLYLAVKQPLCLGF